MSHSMQSSIPANLQGDRAFAALIRDALAHMFPLNACRLADDDSGCFIICEDDAGRDWSLAIYRDGAGGR
jgi:hypothetical protein